jgi:hypothetical protein
LHHRWGTFWSQGHEKRAAGSAESFGFVSPQPLGAQQDFPAIDHGDEGAFTSEPMPPDAIEHQIAARSLRDRFRQGVTPPRQPHLTQHRLGRAHHDPRQPPVKLKSYA